jgi:hypothetical protein
VLNHFSLFAVLAKLKEPSPAKFEVSNLTISPPQARLNQEVDISIDVTNTGEKNGDYSLELKVDGVVKSNKQLTVAGGKSQTINFTITGDAVGKHGIQINGLVSEFEIIKIAEPFKINWWLIGSLIGIIIVLAIWSLVGWRWFKERKKVVPATDASADVPANKSDE